MCTFALEVRDLSKSYERFSIKDLNFAVPVGSIMGFVGPNGAGKTTTIKSILNMVNIDKGDIKILGESFYNRAPENVGVVTEVDRLYEGEWRVRDIEKIMQLYHKQWDKGVFDSLLEKWNLDRGKKVKELSSGMGVKMMIAVALSHNAKLLILDEPTSGLDPVARDEVCGLLLEYVSNKDRSVFFSTHITSDIEKIADKITIILNGKIVFTGDTNLLLRSFADEVDTGTKAKPATLDDIIVKMNRGDMGA